MPENEKLVNLFKLEEKAKRLQRMIDEARKSNEEVAAMDFSEVRRVALEILYLVN